MISLLRFFVILFVILTSLGCSPKILEPDLNHLEETEVESHPDAVQGSLCPIYFPVLNLCAEFVPQESPVPVRKHVSFNLQFRKVEGGFVSGDLVDPGLTPSVFLWMVMKTGSHGSKLPDNPPRSQGVGKFVVTPLVFTMHGVWQIHLRLLKDDQVVEEGYQEILI